MTQISSTLLAPAPPPKRGGASPPDSPPDAPFASVLEDQARTAAAEGRSRRSAAEAARRDDERGREVAPDRGPSAGDAPASIREDADAPALAALLGGLPLPAGVVTGDLSVSAAPATVEGAAAAVAPIPTGPAVPAGATALPLGPAETVPAAGQPAPAAAAATATPIASPGTDGATMPNLDTPATGDRSGAAAKPLVPPGAAADSAAVPDGPHAAAGAAPATADGANAQAAPGPAAAADRAAAQPAAAGGQQAAATTAPAAPTQAAATTPAAAPVAPPTHAAGRGVGLAEAVETVKLAFRAASERGVWHARIALSPRELGGIEIHLKQTSDGLVARVVAEHQTAAQLLHQAGAELRRSLESQGLTLLQLDIGAAGADADAGRRDLASGGDADAHSGDGGAAANGRGAAGVRGAHGDDTAADLALDPTATDTLALPNGALVDVLA